MYGFQILLDYGWCGQVRVCVYVCGEVLVVVYCLFHHSGGIGLCGQVV